VQQRPLYEVPSVFGLSIREAQALLSEAGFEPVASPQRFPEDAIDVVGSTLPPAGAALPKGARVDLLPAPVRSAEDGLTEGIVPNVIRLTSEEAIRIVEVAGYRAYPKDAYTLSGVDPGLVFGTDPQAETPYTPGFVVVLWVSLGDGGPVEPTDMTPPVTVKE